MPNTYSSRNFTSLNQHLTLNCNFKLFVISFQLKNEDPDSAGYSVHYLPGCWKLYYCYICIAGLLRTFARKSSNINFFIKHLLQLGYEIRLSSRNAKTNWGVTDFVSEIRYLKGHPNFEKNRSSLLDMAPTSVCLKILQMKLYNRMCYANFYMSGSIKQIKTNDDNVSLSKFHF